MWKSRHACVLSVTDVWQSLPWQGVERCKISAIKFHEQNTQRLNWQCHLPNSQEKINYFKVDSSLIMMFRSVSCYTSHSQAVALKKLRLGFFLYLFLFFVLSSLCNFWNFSPYIFRNLTAMALRTIFFIQILSLLFAKYRLRRYLNKSKSK